MKNRNRIIQWIIFLGWLAAIPWPFSVQAQAGSASALIGAVNAYRAANGLAPYDIDSSLMSEAQAQSEYMASIGSCTHQRADGSSPQDHGISAENVACGASLTVEGAVYSQWTDATHSATILGPDTGLVGAGMAVSGNNVYYTLAVKRLTGNFNYRPPKTNDQPTAPPGQNTYTPNPQPVANSVMTVTPREDGSLTHVIQYGQTLIDIAKAYGISVNDLYAANKGLNPTRPVYYAGDSLVIRPAFTATSSPTITQTPQPPTRTPTPTRTATRVPPTRTPTRTFTPTPWVSMPEVKIPEENRSGIAYGLILISVSGLTFVIIRGFIQKDR